ncbi:MAG TPA: sigma-70 family RNA polymerase sigma factor [Acidimicrobiia bacterium]|jgi:RNA polymerase sigma-70 factor (ECF subfamily)
MSEQPTVSGFSDELSEHSGPLYRFALTITRDPHLAADLVQDTFVRALERSDQYRGEAPLRAWLRQILHNLAIDRARRAAKEMVVEDVEENWHDDAYTVDPAAVAERTLTREELEDGLARLPFIYRVVVILHDVEGWTVRQIAEVQDISLPAAKQRLRRGRMSLVSALAEGHERRKQLEGVPMRCWDARQHVSDYLDGTLDEATAHLVEAHLEVCPTCPPLYAALVGAHQSLGALRDPDAVIPPQLEQRIQSLLDDAGR